MYRTGNVPTSVTHTHRPHKNNNIQWDGVGVCGGVVCGGWVSGGVWGWVCVWGGGVKFHKNGTR